MIVVGHPRDFPPATSSAQSALGYIRVSREEQARDGVSLDVQRARIAAYAAAKGLDLTAVYSDEGISGKELDRPGLRKLLERCADGRIGHVVLWKLDRLTRRTRHLLSLVEDLFLAHGVEMHSVSESLDTATPHGRFVVTMLGGLAQMEREVIADRTRGALAWKRENGLPTSHPPLGFRSLGKRTPMEPVQDELRIVRRILALWRTGRSYRAIAAGLNAEAVQTKRRARWHHTTVAKVVAARERYAPHLDDVAGLSDTPERACPLQWGGGGECDRGNGGVEWHAGRAGISLDDSVLLASDEGGSPLVGRGGEGCGNGGEVGGLETPATQISRCRNALRDCPERTDPKFLALRLGKGRNRTRT